jgi:hypothetical protein
MFQNQYLDLPATLLVAKKPGRDNFGIINNQEVPRLQYPGKIEKMMIGKRFLGAFHQKETRSVTTRGRNLSNQFFRQVIVVILKVVHETESLPRYEKFIPPKRRDEGRGGRLHRSSVPPFHSGERSEPAWF